MSDILRELIEMIRTEEEITWGYVTDHYDLCHECGGMPAGNYVKGYGFKCCDPNDCDIAFEQMCEDFIDETGNGNSTRCLMDSLYCAMKDHDDLEWFAEQERDWLEGLGNNTKDMTQEDLIWHGLNGYVDDRRILNERIVEYWRQDRRGDEE
tara:strand:- start:374 stop:829 length:456 start_codon:yes stop_codon:yes gene_type:complete